MREPLSDREFTPPSASEPMGRPDESPENESSHDHGEAPWPMVAALVFTATLTLLFFFFNGPVVDLEKSIVRPS